MLQRLLFLLRCLYPQVMGRRKKTSRKVPRESRLKDLFVYMCKTNPTQKELQSKKPDCYFHKAAREIWPRMAASSSTWNIYYNMCRPEGDNLAEKLLEKQQAEAAKRLAKQQAEAAKLLTKQQAEDSLKQKAKARVETLARQGKSKLQALRTLKRLHDSKLPQSSNAPVALKAVNYTEEPKSDCAFRGLDHSETDDIGKPTSTSIKFTPPHLSKLLPEHIQDKPPLPGVDNTVSTYLSSSLFAPEIQTHLNASKSWEDPLESSTHFKTASAFSACVEQQKKATAHTVCTEQMTPVGTLASLFSHSRCGPARARAFAEAAIGVGQTVSR